MKNCIKVERIKIGITQDQLAAEIKVSRQTVHSIETCKFVPSTIIALKIAKFFNANLEAIFQLELTD